MEESVVTGIYFLISGIIGQTFCITLKEKGYEETSRIGIMIVVYLCVWSVYFLLKTI